MSFIVFTFNASGQKHQNKVFQKIVKADSVFLVSHLITYVPVLDDKTNERTGFYKLVDKKRVNYNIIKESFLLDKSEADSIAAILITENRDSIIQDIQCFEPHHGILIFKKGKCSYFDICFGCRHFITSKDIKISDELSDKTWNDLESFFRNRNLKYEMPKNESEEENDN